MGSRCNAPTSDCAILCNMNVGSCKYIIFPLLTCTLGCVASPFSKPLRSNQQEEPEDLPLLPRRFVCFMESFQGP